MDREFCRVYAVVNAGEHPGPEWEGDLIEPERNREGGYPLRKNNLWGGMPDTPLLKKGNCALLHA